MKEVFCQWLEEWWDHRFIVSADDPWAEALLDIDESVVTVDFNPTAENMAQYLCFVIGPLLVKRHGLNAYVREVVVEETSKCRATCGVYL
jgi:6-pyruvoyltetrahydropterin/6-carboxytetrahydropterin synthase